MYLADFNINVRAAESASIYDQAKAQKLANSCRVSVSQLSVAQSDLVVGADGLSGTGLVVADANSEKGFRLASGATFTESTIKIFKSDDTTVYPVESVNPSSGVATLYASDPAGKAVDTISSTGEASFSLEPTGGVYSIIVIRIWIEGQHPDCLNEIAGQTISIDLTWQTYREAV